MPAMPPPITHDSSLTLRRLTPIASAMRSSSKVARKLRPRYDFSKRHRKNDISATTMIRIHRSSIGAQMCTGRTSSIRGIPTTPSVPPTNSTLRQTTASASLKAKVAIARYIPTSR